MKVEAEEDSDPGDKNSNLKETINFSEEKKKSNWGKKRPSQ